MLWRSMTSQSVEETEFDSDAPDLAPEGPVLVIGGAGYIGSHTTRMLEARNVPVAVFDNLSTGHRAAVDVELEVADLADRDRLADVFTRLRPRAVIHFAAKCYVGESVEHPALYYRENVLHTFNLLEAARAKTRREIPDRVVARRSGDPPELVSGGNRAGDLLGWRPRHSSLEQIVADAWRFMRRHPQGYAD